MVCNLPRMGCLFAIFAGAFPGSGFSSSGWRDRRCSRPRAGLFVSLTRSDVGEQIARRHRRRLPRVAARPERAHRDRRRPAVDAAYVDGYSDRYRLPEAVGLRQSVAVRVAVDIGGDDEGLADDRGALSLVERQRVVGVGGPARGCSPTSERVSETEKTSARPRTAPVVPAR